MDSDKELSFQDLTPQDFYSAAEAIAGNSNLEELTFENCSWVNAHSNMYGPEEIEEAIQFLPNLRIVRFKGVRSIWQGKGRESFHQLIESLLTIESLEQIVVENAHLLSKTIRLLRTSGKLSEYHLINNDRGYEMEESSSEDESELETHPYTPFSIVNNSQQMVQPEISDEEMKLESSEELISEDQSEVENVEYQQKFVQVRKEQSIFKKKLLRVYHNRCCVSGDQIAETLVAAHILPIAEGGGYKIPNGLLLNIQWHRFFDLLMFYIDEDYRIHLCDKLKEFFDYDNQTIELPKSEDNYPSLQLLGIHRVKALKGKYFK